VAKEKNNINKFFNKTINHLSTRKPNFFNSNISILKKKSFTVLSPFKNKNVFLKKNLGKGKYKNWKNKHKKKRKWIRLRPFFRRVEFFMKKKRLRRRFFRYSGLFTFRRKRTYRPYKKRKLVKRRLLGGFLNKRRNTFSNRKPITRIKHRYRFRKRSGFIFSIKFLKKWSLERYKKKKKWKRRLKKEMQRQDRIQRLGRRYIFSQIIRFMKTVIQVFTNKKNKLSLTTQFPITLIHNSLAYKKLDSIKNFHFNVNNSVLFNIKPLSYQFFIFYKIYKRIYFCLFVKKSYTTHKKIKNYIFKK
jgi:hypothetical protein